MSENLRLIIYTGLYCVALGLFFLGVITYQDAEIYTVVGVIHQPELRGDGAILMGIGAALCGMVWLLMGYTKHHE